MNKKTYLKLQLKRTAKLYPTIFFITLITLLIICVAGSLILKEDSSNKARLKIGLVGNTEDSYLNIGLTALENLDSSRFSVEFIKQTEDEAKKELAEHNTSGYIYIPEDFVKDIFYGKNTPATYVMSDKLTAFEGIIMAEIAMCISDIVVNSQNSIYGMQLLAFDYDKTIDLDNKINKMNLSYVDTILSREEMFAVEETGILDSVTMGGYYICGIFLFFILIWGISCNKLFSKNNIAMSRLLTSRGLNSFWQIFCEYISFFIVTIVTFLFFAIIFGIIVGNNDFGVIELKNAGVFSCVGYIIKCIPVILMILSLEMLIYEMVGGTINAVILQFIIAIILGYLSGLIYPNTFFPEGVQTFASILPSGIGFSYLRKTMSNSPMTQEMLSTLLYFVTFFTSTVLVRKFKAEGDRQ